MKNIKNKVTSAIFATCIIGGFVATIISPKRDVSANENRTLAKAPKLTVKTLLNGDFATDYEIYLSDQFILRDGWIAVKSLSEMALLKKDINGVYLCDDNYLMEMNREGEEIDKDKATANVSLMAKFVNNYSSVLGKDHVKAMIVPTASYILADKMPKFATTFDQKTYLDNIKKEIPDNYIDVSEELLSHKDEYIFYRTDHHWTMYGAYVGYCKWATECNITPYSKKDFKITDTKDFKGTIYSKLNFALETDTMSIYEPLFDISYKVSYEDVHTESNSLLEKKHLNTKDKYQVYLDGNHSVTRIDTSVKNGKTLLVIKDSYANSFMTLAANHYETIYMVDLRYFRSSLAEFIKEKEITDILVLYNAITFAGDSYLALFGK